MRHRSSLSCIEPLEARIAPALLVAGANLLGGAGNPTTGESSLGETGVTLVKMVSGQAIVWYDGLRISGISFGHNASMEITGDVRGDIVGNLAPGGRLSDSDNNPINGEDGNVLLPNTLAGLKVTPLSGGQKGDVNNIITGGHVSNVNISGSLSGIYAGDGAFFGGDATRPSSEVLSGLGVAGVFLKMDVNPVELGIQQGFSLSLLESRKGESLFGLIAGASVKNITMAKASELQIIAGSGNPNAETFLKTAPAGGSILNIAIDAALIVGNGETPSYALLAGDGGSGPGGGAGGTVNKVIEKSAAGEVLIHGGLGGAATMAAGGAGGSVVNLDLQSNSSQYTVRGGSGGTGIGGGAGGELLNNNFVNRTPLGGLLVAADFDGDGLEDLLVVDQGTGGMVINVQLNPVMNGRQFEQKVQYIEDMIPVTLIKTASFGSTPIAAAASDYDNDGDLDVLLAFKNSDSLGVFINQGSPTEPRNEGIFVFKNDLDEFVADGTSYGLGFSPTKMLLLDGDASRIAFAEVREGEGVLRLARKLFSDGDYSFSVDTKFNRFGSLISDMDVSKDGELFVAFASGSLFRMSEGGAKEELYSASRVSVNGSVLLSVAGGISDIDFDSAGDRLLVLSTVGRTLQTFDIQDDAVVPAGSVNVASGGGRPLVAHFLPGAEGAEDRVGVLSALPGSARITFFDPVQGNPLAIPPTASGYTLDRSLTTNIAFKNFVALEQEGIAALAGSLNQFSYSDDRATTTEYALPFAGKKVFAFGGAGGTAFDFAAKIGRGGNGGAIVGINVDAQEIELESGVGGGSATGSAGHGGNISNPVSFISASGSLVAPAILADSQLNITAGDGGSPTLLAPVGKPGGAGGAGGSVTGIFATLAQGDFKLNAGDGGDGLRANAGAGGSLINTRSVTRSGQPDLATIFTLTAGTGGDVLAGPGIAGKGGTISGLKYDLTLDEAAELIEAPFAISLFAGAGGNAPELPGLAGGTGGAGGDLTGISLTLDGPNTTDFDTTPEDDTDDSLRDSTVSVVLVGGAGGRGANGGAGGDIRDLKQTSVYDQISKRGFAKLTSVTTSLVAGDGGAGSNGSGGSGGSIVLSTPLRGVTEWDKDLQTPPTRAALEVIAGNGGVGKGLATAKGGAGGRISGLNTENAPGEGVLYNGNHLLEADLRAGDGGASDLGDGGAGGAIDNSRVAVSGSVLLVQSGDGGRGGALAGAVAGKGGAGGGILSSFFGAVRGDTFGGMRAEAGDGGAGITAGGAGGSLLKLSLSANQATSLAGPVLTGGDGGAASGAAGVGGKGGDIVGLTQVKDVNAAISVLQAGSGGDATGAAGIGGKGGSVSAVKVAGFIGRPHGLSDYYGVIDTLYNEAQGIFAGAGGVGDTLAAAAGSVTKIVARQISAIAAISFASNGTRTISAAASVAGIKADFVGYDIDRDRVFDDGDGFIRGKLIGADVAKLMAGRTTFVQNS